MSDDGPSGWKIQQVMRVWHERQTMLLAEDGELTDAAQKRAAEALAGGLEGMEVWIVRAWRNAKAMAAAVKQERQDLAVREKRFEARADGLRNSLTAMIEASVEPDKDGKRKVVLPIGTISVAPGERELMIEDGKEANIPDEFYDEIVMVKVRKGLRKSDLARAVTKERIDEETGEVLPPLSYDGVTISNGPP
jgi:hypothetical protein